MAGQDTSDALMTAIVELDELRALDLVRQRLANGDDPMAIIDDCQHGMRQVGERYERQEYYLSGLIMAGEIFRQILEIVQPNMERIYSGDVTGHVLLGTVQGDIHDIGKDILHILLRCFGFTVEDLGVDVPPQQFLTHALANPPDIIGLSGILTNVFDSMRETVRILREDAPPEIGRIPIIIGGSQLNEEVCRYVGADYWTSDAATGIQICRRIVEKRERTPAASS